MADKTPSTKRKRLPKAQRTYRAAAEASRPQARRRPQLAVRLMASGR